MKRKTKLEILLGNLEKASSDMKKAMEESQKRLDESFAKYQHKVEIAHNETQK
jgi:hypothetical protein